MYCKASGMSINIHKSAMVLNELDEEVEQTLRGLFPFSISGFQDGIKYLRLNLKPNGYGKRDWIWLLSKIENRINFGFLDGCTMVAD